MSGLQVQFEKEYSEYIEFSVLGMFEKDVFGCYISTPTARAWLWYMNGANAKVDGGVCDA